MMEFKVLEDVKKEIEKRTAKGNKAIKIIKIFEYVMLTGTLYCIVAIIYNIVMPDAWLNEFRDGIRKDYWGIFMLWAPIMGMFGTAWILVRTLSMKVASLGLSERIEETLGLTDEGLFYTYRLKYQSTPNERGVVAVKLDEIESAVYDNAKSELTLRGKMFDRWYDNVAALGEVDIAEREDGELTLYDYFSPSLVETLEQRAVKIERGG